MEAEGWGAKGREGEGSGDAGSHTVSRNLPSSMKVISIAAVSKQVFSSPTRPRVRTETAVKKVEYAKACRHTRARSAAALQRCPQCTEPCALGAVGIMCVAPVEAVVVPSTTSTSMLAEPARHAPKARTKKGQPKPNCHGRHEQAMGTCVGQPGARARVHGHARGAQRVNVYMDGHVTCRMPHVHVHARVCTCLHGRHEEEERGRLVREARDERVPAPRAHTQSAAA